MYRTKIRLIIDSYVKEGLGHAELSDLQHSVMNQVSRLGICGQFKVTLEYDGECGDGQPLTASDEKEASDRLLLGLLSERQRQIAELLCRPYSIKRIAEELYLSENTVKKHIQNMKKALKIECSGGGEA